MTKVYLVSVHDFIDDAEELGIFSSMDLAEEYVYKTYNQHKNEWNWQGKAWYVEVIELDHPEVHWESVLINVYDQPSKP